MNNLITLPRTEVHLALITLRAVQMNMMAVQEAIPADRHEHFMLLDHNMAEALRQAVDFLDHSLQEAGIVAASQPNATLAQATQVAVENFRKWAQELEASPMQCAQFQTELDALLMLVRLAATGCSAKSEPRPA